MSRRFLESVATLAVVSALLVLFRATATGTGFPARIDGSALATDAGNTEKGPQEKRKPSPQDEERLKAVAERVGAALVLLVVPVPADGDQYVGTQGTGFVISRKLRLVATAGHVAHEFSRGEPLRALLNGTARVYHVERAFYHPGMIRKLDDGLYARSNDPRDGSPSDGGPDLAVLQLADEGPELPCQAALAEDQDLRDLVGQSVGLLSYPISIEDRWPTASRPANASNSTTVIEEMYDSSHNVDVRSPAAPSQRQTLRYQIEFGPGASGSPLFLPNGRVVGLVVSAGKVVEPGASALRGAGFRADCLRELLAYHALDGATACALTQIRSRSDWGPDPRIKELRRAVRLVRDAVDLRRSADYRAAQLKCDDALSLAPNYGGALLQRSKVYLYFLGTEWGRLNHEQRLAHASSAYADSSRCIELYPWWNEAYLIDLQNIIYISCLTSQPQELRKVLESAADALAKTNLSSSFTEYERSFLINICAQCHHFLGEMEQAANDYDESIRLAPLEPRWHLNRAQFRDQRGLEDLAEMDRLTAETLRRSAAFTERKANGKSPPSVDSKGGNSH